MRSRIEEPGHAPKLCRLACARPCLSKQAEPGKPVGFDNREGFRAALSKEHLEKEEDQQR